MAAGEVSAAVADRATGTGPVQESKRERGIDAVRGLAVLGILMVNVAFFAYPYQIYYDPRIGGLMETALDRVLWVVMYVGFEFKMMAIFSMLFGVGLAAMVDRAGFERIYRNREGELIETPRSIAKLHYKRMAWLLLFGVLHGYLLWYGDILFIYAICGMALYPLRTLSVKWLIILGTLLNLVVIPLLAGTGVFLQWAMSSNNAEISAAMVDEYTLTPEAFAKVAEAYRGSFVDGLVQRAPETLTMHLGALLSFGLWRNLGLMLIGIALFRLGIVTGAKPVMFYVRLMAVGYGVGVPLAAIGAWDLLSHDFDIVRLHLLSAHFNYIGSVFMALGHMSVVLLIWKSGARWVLEPLARVGQMAFTNYIMQSFIGAVIFMGWGFGQYGSWSRLELTLLVLGVWALQLVASPLWLKAFSMGPLEWVWRRLTYGTAPAFRRGAGTAAAV